LSAHPGGYADFFFVVGGSNASVITKDTTPAERSSAVREKTGGSSKVPWQDRKRSHFVGAPMFSAGAAERTFGRIAK
jgi:hypothetical protein